ncbi:mitogen-activated protein kinase 15 [Talpa occidentalis]|uniref:mitogen-activated protein kinase 15 n=1 Tax=Talpa occidentalis TaxID=50954 RepID=UPI0018905411|nr:mitogen-activated protein kinase 15 [Talpa occidentalis]
MSAAELDRHVARRYLLKRRLGKGAYGIVWKAVDRRTGEVVAIKKIFDAFRNKTDAQRTFREVALLQEFGGHPNIIRLLDVIRAENDRDIYLVFESMDTDLHAVIREGRLLRDTHKRFIFYQLLRATKFIHSGGVVHRDQKPSNVLLNASCLVKLCDFGLARSLSGLPEGPEGQALTEYVATRWYRAPEVLLSSSWYTPGVDMWGLGCILGEMLRGRPLFPGTSTLHQLELILETIPLPSEEDLLALGPGRGAWILQRGGARPRRTLDALLPADTPPEALDLLRRLLVFAPGGRLSAARALRHPYVRRFHRPEREWSLEAEVRLPVDEAAQLSAPEYRSRLYQLILDRGEKGPGGAPAGAELAAPALKPGAAPPTPAGPRAPHPGPWPQGGHGSPAHEAPGGADGRPRRSPAPQPPPAAARSGEDAAPGVAPAPRRQHPAGQRPRAPAPSLASQAAAAAADRGPPGLPRGRAPEPRPGRRMFGPAAAQGAQAAARAALGGYAQAFGTVRRSALGRPPLPPGVDLLPGRVPAASRPPLRP